MDKLSYHRHHYPSIVIQQAIWLYFRFALSYRDVEDMLAERGIDVSYETVRRWALKFGAIIARRLRRGRPRPDLRWHLDEVFVSINGRQLYVWRAVDSEGEVAAEAEEADRLGGEEMAQRDLAGRLGAAQQVRQALRRG